MNRKKIWRNAAVLLLVLSWCFSLAGCGFRYAVNNDNYARDESSRIPAALDQQNKQAFKNLFSKEALENIGGIDGKIDGFFSFIKEPLSAARI